MSRTVKSKSVCPHGKCVSVVGQSLTVDRIIVSTKVGNSVNHFFMVHSLGWVAVGLRGGEERVEGHETSVHKPQH